MTKEWVAAQQVDNAEAKRLAATLNCPEIFARMALRRGLNSAEAIQDFLEPTWEDLHDPFLIRDMQVAVDKLFDVVQSGQKILVYGDYDVDGTSAVALVVSYLREIGATCDYYIPDRYKEGYGFSEAGIVYAEENNISLIITLDCGIKDAARIDRAKDKGIKVIVCDHHTPGDELPRADAVLNPKRKDCSYPYKELCGCAVGFKLMCGLNQRLGRDPREMEKYLDLVALATGADIVDMTGENRVLATLGLAVLNRHERVGINALLQQAKFTNNTLDITNVVFIIAPRINAAGRIFSGQEAVNLMLETDVHRAQELAASIEKFNKERKEFEAAITAEAKSQYLANTTLFSDGIVVHGYQWHKGVVGIVASKLVESFGKPAIVLTTHNGELHGSGRSTTDMDLYKVLESCREHIIQFGGHKMAAGLSMLESNLNSFAQCFNESVRQQRGATPPALCVYYEEELAINDVTLELYDLIKKLEPFGPGNDKPYFLIRGVCDSGESRAVGKDNSHLKVSIDAGSRNLGGIGYGMADQLPLLQPPLGADVLVSIEINTWKNRVNVEVNVREIRKSE